MTEPLFYGGSEIGTSFHLMKCRKWGNQYGRGVKCKELAGVEAFIRGQVQGDVNINLSCDLERCKLTTYMSASWTVDFRLQFGWFAFSTNLAGDKFVDNKKISEMEFPSPLSGVGK